MTVCLKTLPVTKIRARDKSWAGADQEISAGLQEMFYLALGTPAAFLESCKFILWCSHIYKPNLCILGQNYYQMFWN